MASVESNSQPATGSSGSDVHPDASVTTVNENNVLKADTEARLLSGEAAAGTLSVIECPVCLQPCVYPVQLPCTHVFCFLCVKGVAGRNRRCALCRAEIPQEFVRRPVLVGRDAVTVTAAAPADQQHSKSEDKFCWYYEGVGGWWEYDERTSIEIEKYQNDRENNLDDVPASFELLIAGFIYIIDLENNVQYRRGYPARRRRIKRDFAGIPDCKGVAGLCCRKKRPERPGGDGKEAGAADHGAAVSSVPSVQSSSSSDNQPTVSLADSSVAVGASHTSSSVVAGRQQTDAITDQLTDVHLSDSGLRQRRRNGPQRDTQDTLLGRDRHQSADRN